MIPFLETSLNKRHKLNKLNDPYQTIKFIFSSLIENGN